MRNKPVLIVFIGLPLVAALCVTWAALTATFHFEWQGQSFAVTGDGRLVADAAATAIGDLSVKDDSDTNGTPKAIIPVTSHDFGTMNPLTMGRHAFTIRNDGTAPLRIQKGPTTCKCTLSSVGRNEVLPGEEVKVTLDWNTGRDKFYSHSATIFTSDPNQKQVHLNVHGKVRMQIGTLPKTFQFANLRPDRPSSAEVVVYSQVWDSFDLVDGSVTDDRIKWNVETINSEELDDAKAAYRVRVELPAGMPSGYLSEQLRFAISATGDDKEETTLNLPIKGKVPRRLAVLGPSIGSDGIVDLGQVYIGESRKKRLLLKVRDEDRELIATQIKCEPAFVTANVLPYEGNTQNAGLSTLEIELPKDAPACSFLSVPMGSLRIDFDHPRIQDLELKLKFAVLEKS